MTGFSFFAFPLDLILAVLWMTVCVMLYRHAGDSRIVRFMLSAPATVLSVSLMAVLCLVTGLTGSSALMRSWPAAVVMLFLMTVLLFVLLRGWRVNGRVRWRFVLNHAGLLLALSSAFWGTPDSETLRVQAFMDTPVREAYRMDGSRAWLPYEMELKDFEVRLSDEGTPSYFAAKVAIDGVTADISVNHPYSISFSADLYLNSYDPENGEWCILQYVREPWKYPALAGIVMMLAGAVLIFIQGPRKDRFV